MFSPLSKAGVKAFSNMAVGYNNVDVSAANKHGVAVGNTPVRLPDIVLEVTKSLFYNSLDVEFFDVVSSREY